MSLIANAQTLVENLAQSIPLELYVPIGALIEEIIAPIPSPIVMTTAGSIANAQNLPLSYIFFLAPLGAIGKTLGAWVLYTIADKAEDLVLTKFGKLIGVSHREVESIGKHFKGGIRDDIILTVIRATPVIPSAPVSVVCGVLKIKLRTFLISTLAGTTVRNALFLYFGFAGLATFENIVSGLNTFESIIQAIMVLFVGAIIIWAYHKRRRSKD
ncbi:MAG TPA: VTT domain-containing protein [Patescibacteria group bacterium]